ncbi:MAG: glycoside hydrolase family 3 C-terminal domain-containing protein, partial [Bacteroidota bacterium]
WIDDVDAILHAWYPGEKGGQAIAEILFGDVNPSGKLPITYPKTIGQVPWNYNDKVGYTSHYIGVGNEPQFPFGFGLSYNKYEYSNLKLSKSEISQNDSVIISLKVKNDGNYQGDEIVQLYIHDKIASMVRPAKELKRFRRVSLKPNEIKEINFTLFADDFMFLNRKLEKILEPGEVEILIGKSSANIVLKEVVTINNK